MTSRTINVEEAKNQLPDLLAPALDGNEVIITEGGKPVARLVPITSPQKKRVAGLNRGKVSASADFDEPLPDEFWVEQQ